MFASLVLLALFFGSPSQESSIPLGQIVEKVTCAQDPAQSYALYLPRAYDKTRKWPVLYAFDPGARGRVPVERFKDAAEQFGWIVVGSNNSRNASIQSSLDSWNAMIRDTTDKFSIDDGRAYAAGFSGGARVALTFATQCKDCLAGVIAGGAGFPPGIEPAATMRFAIFAIAGLEDFNFPEIKELDDKLARVNIPHQIAIWEGRHEWPPSAVAAEAVAWMELTAMKSGRRERDARLIESLWAQQLKQAQQLEQAKRLFESYQAYLKLSSSFKGLHEVAEADDKLNALRASREVREAIRDEQQQIKKQNELEGQLIDLLAAADRAKLREEQPERNTAAVTDESADPDFRLKVLIGGLRRQSKAEEDSATRRVARRVLSGQYVGLSERASNALQTLKRYDDAIRLYTLATEIDPERPGAFYNLAWAYAAKGDKKKALKALQTAAEKGFKDHAAVSANSAFASLRSDPAYLQLIERMRTN
ncbi:MAG TPA: tetratricopeptide repeat protein [Pyrinomonadaceae bacterium]|nr:tetratricopeptide repeat protein [Pyrinomonadaceae bacterium]